MPSKKKVDAELVAYPAYQCLKMRDTMQVYCSKTKVKSHAVGSQWVSAVIAHYSLTGPRDVYSSNSQPSGATIYP
jgi:hypothetical protein